MIVNRIEMLNYNNWFFFFYSNMKIYNLQQVRQIGKLATPDVYLQ